VNKDALIISSSISGIQAAIDMAEAGYKVHLVESSPFLENHKPTSIPPHILNTRLLEIIRHPNIHLWTNSRLSRLEGTPGDFKVELRRHPRYVDATKCTACGDCIAVCPVINPDLSHSDKPRKVIYIDGQPGCAAIDKAGKAPCTNTCPGGIHVQGYVALIAQGRFQEAIDLIREAIPFPAICGRVCTHPCEINCRRAEIDKPVAVRLLKRFVSDWELSSQSKESTAKDLSSKNEKPNGKRVAVIGAGPSGMVVAERLAHLGYQITIFEKLPVIGGMMAVGIPQYRLPSQVIEREYQHILDLGIELRLNTTIGPRGDYMLDDLFALGFEAICLTVGAHQSQTLNIPGEELPGVVHGIELLKVINLSQRLADMQQAEKFKAELQQLLRQGTKTRVAILGGGNTAMDASRALIRLGVKDVRILYRRSRAEMPAMPEEIVDAEQEGIKIEYLTAPERVLGDEASGVTGLECMRMRLGEPDASGRRRPVPIANSEFVLDLDLVILAIGQNPDLGFLEEGDGIAITRDKRINVADLSFMTDRPGVFAAGDAVTRDKMVVIEAIGMGKQAAAAIDAYLRGQPLHQTIVDARAMATTRRTMTEAELIPIPRITVPAIPLAQRKSSFSEVELGYSAEQAITEARRCLACGPCSECMACVLVCKTGAINHEQQETFTELNIGAIIYSAESSSLPPTFVSSDIIQDKLEGRGFYLMPADSALSGSAVAAQVMLALGSNGPQGIGSQSLLGASLPSPRASPIRAGVFICQCGDAISRVVDTQAVADSTANLPEVIHTQVLPFSCSADGSQTINAAIEMHQLNRVVLAACPCCSIDQVCYSCTYQRLRCKDNLGLFTHSILRNSARPVRFVCVNIREQCAWVHSNDPQAATAKATALIEASVARSIAAPPWPMDAPYIERSALILGSGSAGTICQATLNGLGVATRIIKNEPAQIQRLYGQYLVTQGNGSTDFYRSSVLILAPNNAEEADKYLSAFGQETHQPRPQQTWGGVDTHRPGIFLCDPDEDPDITGFAAAARATAWLGRIASRLPVASVVDPARCRACNTCVEICEFGAPGLVEIEGRRASWIDPMICTSCGVCAVHCSSGAITAGYSTDTQIDAMLASLLDVPVRHEETT
jgi:NADPH-dependent glutamate synthase beta subunit-like oxidoreductase/formate hydrogenlyase subunit 6/NADH:ubiquinone oxidoreductase subunit I